MEVVLGEIDVLILIVGVFTPVPLYLKHSSPQRVEFMPHLEHSKARLDGEYSCKSLLALRGVEEAVEILF